MPSLYNLYILFELYGELSDCTHTTSSYIYIRYIDIFVSFVYHDDPFLKICFVFFFCHGTLDQSDFLTLDLCILGVPLGMITLTKSGVSGFC